MDTLTESIIAYRGWAFTLEGMLEPLGISAPIRWPMTPRYAQAVCVADQAMYWMGPGITKIEDVILGKPHNAPSKNCVCGLYGFKTVEALSEVFSAPVLGRVALWGRCIETEHGWRAEYGYPQVFYMPKEVEEYRKAQILKASQLYRVEVVPLPDKIEEALEAIRYKQRQDMSTYRGIAQNSTQNWLVQANPQNYQNYQTLASAMRVPPLSRNLASLTLRNKPGAIVAVSDPKPPPANPCRCGHSDHFMGEGFCKEFGCECEKWRKPRVRWDWKHAFFFQALGFLSLQWDWWKLCDCGHLKCVHGGIGDACLIKGIEGGWSESKWCNCGH